jgi:hypothetical protein
MTTLPVAWLIARASGLVALGLLTLSVWLGLAMSTRLLGPKRQKPLLALHRTLAWTSLAMVGLHVGGILLDPVLRLRRPRGARARRRDLAPARCRTGNRRGLAEPRPRRLLQRAPLDRQKGWRRLHYATFAAFWLALGHALLVGTDLRGLGGPITALLAAGPVLWLTFYRLLVPRMLPNRTPLVPAPVG